MAESEFLKMAFFIGIETALEEAQLSDMQKTAAMERIFITAEQLAKSKAAREAAERAAKKPGLLARLFGVMKNPIKRDLATETGAYQKFRNSRIPLRYASAIGR